MFIAVNAQIKVTSTGSIGIGTSSPSEAVEISGFATKFSFPLTSNHIKVFAYNHATPCIDPSSNGNGTLGYNYYWGRVRTLYINNFHTGDLSDKKLKMNIKGIEDPIGIIKQLNPVIYDLKPELFETVQRKEEREMLEKMGRDNYGLIAQEAEKILPSIVSYDSVFDAKVINYRQLIPILIKATQEQQNTIEALEARIAKLESNIPATKSATTDNTTSTKENTLANTATLAQNIPNPFSNTTRIDIYLPETVKNARLYVYNMQGVQIKSFDINERGTTSVTIEGYTLQAGMLCHCKKVSYYGTMQMA